MERSIVILLWVIYAALLIAAQNIFPAPIGLGVGRYIMMALFYLPLLYRYLLYRWCGCCEKGSSSSSSSSAAGQTDGALTQPLIQGNGGTIEAQNQEPNNQPPPRPRIRYPFLDNVKVFLTAVVVTHHLAVSFGGEGEQMFTIKSSVTVFSNILTIFTRLNQRYFMPLFFFISAFFVPSSYAKGREKFLRSKWKRILLPALVVTFVVYPIAFLFSAWYEYKKWVWVYWLNPQQAWFLYWLLLLNWVYMSIVDSTDSRTSSSSAGDNGDNVTEVERTEGQEQKMPFPSTWMRLYHGVTLCGFVLWCFTYVIPGLNLCDMPLAWGALTADFLMFYAGILAKKHGWLEKDLAEQLDMPLWLFFTMVFVEGALIVSFSILDFIGMAPASSQFVFFKVVVNGAYCVDMCLAMLIIFQRWFNFETKLSKILARSAYCVYLLHTIVILATGVIYLEIFEFLFGSGEGTEVGKIVGGFIIVSLATHAIVWPMSYGLTRVPILRDII